MSELDDLKRSLYGFLRQRVPGLLELLNIYCMTSYSSDCLSLLFKSPSRVYQVFLMHYRGDMVSADYAFTLVFAGGIAQLLGRYELASQLLELAKTGRDSEFIQLVLKCLKG